MLMSKRTHVYVVGAGFSKYAGLPLQLDFTEALLASRSDKAHPMQPLIAHLGKFIHDAFDHKNPRKPNTGPISKMCSRTSISRRTLDII